jgi:hypothetical protein
MHTLQSVCHPHCLNSVPGDLSQTCVRTAHQHAFSLESQYILNDIQILIIMQLRLSIYCSDGLLVHVCEGRTSHQCWQQVRPPLWRLVQCLVSRWGRKLRNV